MTDDTNAQQGAGAATPAESTTTAQTQKPAPRNDAEAAEQESHQAESPPQPTDEEKAAKEKAEAEKQAEQKRRNRTTEHFNKVKGENYEHRRNWNDAAALERRLAELRPTNTPQQRQAGPPTLEEHNYDFAAWSEANSAYQRQQWTKEQEQAATARQQQETQSRYDERASEFADAHPDFFEVVGLIDPQFLTSELQAAVIGHEKGPEIAYHLANNEDELWSLASIRAELLPAAITRLAARLGAAPPPAANQQPAAIVPIQQLPAKPVSQAPAPPPTVGGRSPTETPSEKLTDEEWYRRDVEKRRKR